MKKHLGWMIRMLIAALGVGYIFYTLTWTDQVYLPPGYVVSEGISGGESGRSYPILEGLKNGYTLEPPDDGHGHGPDAGWIETSELVSTGDGPRFKPSFISILKQADGTLLLFGGLLLIPVVLLATLRWWILMRARGIDVGVGRVGRLTLAGFFFNLCMPGTTGGDVMKAYYAAKGTDQRADAVVSIGIDRLCGLIGLVLLVGFVGLLSLHDPLIRRLTIAMWCGLVTLVLNAWLYTSPTLRSRLGLGAKLSKLPGAKVLRNLDAWVSAYRRHLGSLGLAIGLSLVIHLSLASSMMLAGFALGVEQPVLYLISTIPIVLMLWSLPVSGPLGLGPMDYVAVQLIVGSSGTTDQQALMMFVVYRLYLVGVGLFGSLALLGLGAKPKAAADSATET
ncbi:MAG: flippase-like domain-containing protein [Phycisphaeraceae bacterium]|nr:flippase-like domain-containing protein [Phycisphaeraceae bacterium]